MQTFNKIFKFLNKNYWLIIFIVVLVSYGQIIQMLPWQDDNAIFFKLAHIREPAGYLGKGVFGEGPYKYTVAFYYPIYLLFGYQTQYYFLLCLIIYLLSAIAVYQLFKEILGEKGGRVASFIYAAGYISSDGIIRLYNSVGTSLSVIFVSFLFYYYWKFYKNRKKWFYVLSFFFFFLAVEFVRYRTHYLIAIVLLFELIFLSFKKPYFKNLCFSILRLIPFSYVFYSYFILNGDPRGGQVTKYISDILKGDFYKFYGFFSSFSNHIIPEYYVNFFTSLNENIVKITSIRFSYLIATIFTILLLFVIISFKKKRKNRYLSICLFLSVFIWFFINNSIFVHSTLNIGENELFKTFLGGVLSILCVIPIFLLKKEKQKIYLFLLSWIVINLGAYVSYAPISTLETINRYTAHSFLALAGLLGLFYVHFANRKNANKLVLIIISMWGVLNLISSARYQNWVLKNRTNPVKVFYKDLNRELKYIRKGDVIFFDVEEGAEGYFSDAVTVSQMPDTTVIAWRYGIDRDDFKMFSHFVQFKKYILENNIDLNKIKTFFYSKNGLVNTTEKFSMFYNESKYSQINTNFTLVGVSPVTISNKYSVWEPAEVILEPRELITAILPIKLSVKMLASPVNSSSQLYPLFSKFSDYYQINKNTPEISRVFQYLSDKTEIISKTKIITSSEWKERITSNLIDGDFETVWQPNRVLWEKEYDYIEFGLPYSMSVSGVVWVNGYANETPSNYQVEYLNNIGEWEVVSKFTNNIRFDNKEPRVLSFNPITAKKFRLAFTKTINDDAPTIAETWLIPSDYSDLDISVSENILNVPFRYVQDKDTFEKLLLYKKYLGKVQVYWISNKSNNWQTSFESKFEVNLDGRARYYNVYLPVNGTEIEKIKFVLENVPSKMKLFNVSYIHTLEN
ncbi:discoidin domain-containing protein [Patescibacteria group bacterium]